MSDISDNQLADRFSLVGSIVLKQDDETAFNPGAWSGDEVPVLHAGLRGAMFWDQGATGYDDLLMVARKNADDEIEFAEFLLNAPGAQPYLPVFNAVRYGLSATSTTNDQAIEAAVLAAHTAGGGKVYIPEGTWPINAVARFSGAKSNVWIEGAGMGATILQSDGGSHYILDLAGTTNFKVSDLSLDGGGGSSINLRMGSCVDTVIERVESYDTGSAGIRAESNGTDPTVNLMIVGCHVHDVERGIWVAGPAHRVRIGFNDVLNMEESGINVGLCYHGTIVGNVCVNDVLTTNGYSGIRLTNGGAHITVGSNTVARFGRGIGYFAVPEDGSAEQGESAAITGNTVYECNTLGLFIERGNAVATGNIVRNCAQSGSGPAVQVAFGSGCVVTANTIIDENVSPKHTYGIVETNGADYNVIGPNVIKGYSIAKHLIAGENTQVTGGNRIILWDEITEFEKRALFVGDPNTLALSDGASVETWTDAGQAGNSPTNATAAEQPTLETNELNGYPVIRFDGTNDDLTFATFATSSRYTVAMMVKPSGLVSGERFFSGLGTTSTFRLHTGINPGMNAGTGDLIFTEFTITSGAWHLMLVTFNGASSKMRMNGVASTTTGNPGSGVPISGLVINGTGSASWMTNDLAYFAIIDDAITTRHAEMLEGMLMHRFGLASSLPTTHPYRSFAPLVAR